MIEAVGEFKRRGVVESVSRAAGKLVRLGGSNAQRDVFTQLLIDAALASDDRAFARALLDRRLIERPNNRYAQERLLRVQPERVAA